jgi:hypothetical protein
MDAMQIFFGRKKRFAYDIHIHSTKHAVGCLGMQAKQPPTMDHRASMVLL